MLADRHGSAGQGAQQPVAVLDPHPGHATGPRTAEGKARSSKNALKHGLTSQEPVMAEESAEAFESLRQSFIAERQPVGETEETLVEFMTLAAWRLRRVWRMEPGVYASIRARRGRDVIAGAAWLLDCAAECSLEKLGRHEAHFFRQFMQSDSKLRMVQKMRCAGLSRPERASNRRKASASSDGRNGKIAERTPPAQWEPLGPGGLADEIDRLEAEAARAGTPPEAQQPQEGQPVEETPAPEPAATASTGGENGEFAKRTHAPLTAQRARELLAGMRVDPPPLTASGAAPRDELALYARGPDGRLKELARRVLSADADV